MEEAEQKLYALVNGSIQPDSPDSLHCQEVLLPGHLMTMMVKEKLQDYLVGMKEVLVYEALSSSV
jgi:DNA-directed RNA polymerase I subunit RPA2